MPVIWAICKCVGIYKMEQRTYLMALRIKIYTINICNRPFAPDSIIQSTENIPGCPRFLYSLVNQHLSGNPFWARKHVWKPQSPPPVVSTDVEKLLLGSFDIYVFQIAVTLRSELWVLLVLRALHLNTRLTRPRVACGLVARGVLRATVVYKTGIW